MSVVRIQNVPLEPNKHLLIALRSIFGIGKTRAKIICTKIGVPGDKKVKDLDAREVTDLQEAVAVFVTEGDLRRENATQMKRLSDINCYRATRHRKRLPARGQRTRTNARTRRGPSKGRQQGK